MVKGRMRLASTFVAHWFLVQSKMGLKWSPLSELELVSLMTGYRYRSRPSMGRASAIRFLVRAARGLNRAVGAFGGPSDFSQSSSSPSRERRQELLVARERRLASML